MIVYGPEAVQQLDHRLYRIEAKWVSIAPIPVNFASFRVRISRLYETKSDRVHMRGNSAGSGFEASYGPFFAANLTLFSRPLIYRR